MALDTRPDLRSAVQAVDKARTDYRLAVANGSTDPTFGWDLGREAPDIPTFVGVSINIPLRIFDRNQGEKAANAARHRAQRAAGRRHPGAGVQRRRFGIRRDAEQSYPAAPLQDPLSGQAVQVRDTISFSYQHGGASLLDFLQAQQDYRGIQLGYLNLVGAYLTAAGPDECRGRTRGHPMRQIVFVEAGIAALLSLLLAGCDRKVKADTLAGEPPPAEVEHKHGASLVKVDHPERFSLATATRHASAPELNVTGVVSADVSRNVPVISIASGRISRSARDWATRWRRANS